MGVMPDLISKATVDVVALECGIRPINEVALALKADAWLHAHGDLRSVEAERIKSMIRSAFHADDPMWQSMAVLVLQGCLAGALRMPLRKSPGVAQWPV